VIIRALTSYRIWPGSTLLLSTGLMAMTGSVYTDLALRVDRRHTGRAVMALAGAVAGYRRDMARSQAFRLISLSLNHLLDGDADEADAIGALAVEAAAGLKSSRAKDRMRPLQDATSRAHGRGAPNRRRQMSVRRGHQVEFRMGVSPGNVNPIPPADDSCATTKDGWPNFRQDKPCSECSSPRPVLLKSL
jgi:hypothetical protein